MNLMEGETVGDYVSRLERRLNDLEPPEGFTVKIEQRVEKLERELVDIKKEKRGSQNPMGCICPVGAEKTCEGWNCPRRKISIT